MPSLSLKHAVARLIPAPRPREIAFASNAAGDLRFPSGKNVRVFVVAMGQSLGAGSTGVPARSISPISLKVEMLDIGIHSDIRVGNPASVNAAAMEPLDAQRIRGFMPAVARAGALSKRYGETGLNRLGNAMFEDVSAELGFEPRICLWTIAQGGAYYRQIKKGTQPWANGLMILRRAVELTVAEGRRPYLPFVFLRHGESDQFSESYEDNLLEIHSDIQTSYKPILNQMDDIPILLAQPSSFTSSRTPLAMLKVAEAHPERFILSHPSYQLEHSPDCVHLTARGYVQDGDYAWRAARAHLSAKGWTGFRPLRHGVTRQGSTIVIPMLSPTPPLRIDAGSMGIRAGTVHGLVAMRAGLGDELSIERVSIDGGVNLRVELSEDPGEPVRIEYALRGYHRQPRVGEEQPRGSVVDSATPPNHAVHFAVTTPN